jgi:hypothetical protein
VKKTVLLFVFTLLATLSFAQDLKTFTITPPGEGGFSYVLVKGDETKELISIEGKSAEVAAPEDPNGYKLYVTDGAINRAAVTDLITVLKSKKYEPKSDQFTLIADVEFRIKTNGGNLPAGTLTIFTGDKPRNILITASDKNKIITHYIPESGRSYELTYEADGKKETIKGSIPDEKAGGPTSVEIEVNTKFEDAATAATTAGTKSDEKPKDTGQNPFMSFLRLIVGLAVVGGLGYGAYYYYKNNQKIVENMANQAGLIPNQNSDPTGALPPEPVKKELQKIDLGSSATQMSDSGVMGATGATSAPMTPRSKNPRLVTATGDIHLVPEGSQTVGREAADLTLTGESSVSRHHANITRSGDQISITDNGSTNGTYINGTKITAPTVLNPGDTIQFGAIAYRYEE